MKSRLPLHCIFRITFLIIVMGFCTAILAQTEQSDQRNAGRIPLIKASVKVTNACKAGNTCGKWLASMKKVNAIEITNQSIQWYPSLKVEIYACKSPSPTCNKLIASFVCNQSVITYASTLLANGKDFYIQLTDTKSSNSTIVSFTNGSFNGQICGGGATTGPR